MRRMLVSFYLRSVVHHSPSKWGNMEPVLRYEHWILIRADENTTLERPAKFIDAVTHPREFGLYLRRLKGPLGGKRKKWR